jgi:heparan-alpha-glucosaminide N-acetyltransferase
MTDIMNSTGGIAIAGGSPTPDRAERVASVDALRGLVILLMIFVNDVAGVGRAPSWLKHVDVKADAMTLPDVVFPAFLFIAGMSIPLSLQRASASGRTRIRLLAKVLARTFALLVMGVMMVNMDAHNPWYRGSWGLLAYLAMIVAFMSPPRDPSRGRKAWLAARVMGVVALIILALAYRTDKGLPLVLGPLLVPGDTVWLRHSWWGILGLIGWAYLVASLLYLAFGRRREWLIGATAMLALLYVAEQKGLFSRVDSRAWLAWAAPWIRQVESIFEWAGSHVSVGESLGSLASISMAGCCLGSIIAPNSDMRTHGERLRWTIVFGLWLAVAVLLFDPLFGINKIRATPAWCFACALLTTVTWVVLYWLMDVRGHRAWSVIVRPAGTNPLLAYILHPMLYLIAGIAGIPLWFYKSQELPVFVNILGCLMMAFFVVGVTGLITRLGYRMKA